MLRLALFNDEERVVRLALEEFIERRRRFTAHQPADAHHVHDRNIARETLYNLRCTVPEPDPIGFDR